MVYGADHRSCHCPSAELNCYCLRGQDRANPVPLLEAVGAFVRVFAPAAIGVRTVGFVERGMLGELCQWQAQPGKCWWGPRHEGVTL